MRKRTLPALASLASLAVALGVLVIPSTAAAADFEVAVVDFAFVPAERYVNVGDTVTWVWEGEAPHDVTPLDDEAPFPPSETQVEGTHQVTFDEAGSYPYVCTIHAPDMNGVIEVLPAGEQLPPETPEPRPAPEPGALPQAADNVHAALAWASLFADGSAPTVLLARDDVFADALASGSVQGLADAPLLLTPTDSLDDRVAAELERLGAQRVVIFGGVVAVSAAVEQRLRDLGYEVDRVFGETRIQTAVHAAETSFPDARAAILARAFGPDGGDPTAAFADSLAAGGAAAREAIPILLSATGELSRETQEYLAQSSISRIFLVGGEDALSQAVEDALVAMGIEVIRVAGPTRFDTALIIAYDLFPAGPELVLLLEGQAPDAWASGFAAASAAESAAILLSNGDDLPNATLELISQGVPVLCGPLTSQVACERAGIAATALPFGVPGGVMAIMDGEQEAPGPGHPTARADFFLVPTEAPDAFCYEIVVYGLDEPLTGAHIHRGVEGEPGDVVVPLSTALNDFGFLRSCAFDVDPALVEDILANPAGFYANYHTESFPAGAVRGQLFPGEVVGLAELQPTSEVPPSDTQGGGFFFGFANADDHSQLCYFMGFAVGDETVTAAHVHEAPEGENGPVVVPLDLPLGQGSSQCVDADPAIVERMLEDPSGFYVNVHTEEHPDGALRGQVFNPFGGPPPGGASASARSFRD